MVITNVLPQMLRAPDVLRLSGLSRSTLYARVSDGTFPSPTKLGARAVAWRSDDLQKWLSDPAGYRSTRS